MRTLLLITIPLCLAFGFSHFSNAAVTKNNEEIIYAQGFLAGKEEANAAWMSEWVTLCEAHPIPPDTEGLDELHPSEL